MPDLKMPSGSSLEDMVFTLERRVETLEAFLRHADACIVWEHHSTRPGFQEEIEAALGVGAATDLQQPDRPDRKAVSFLEVHGILKPTE